MTDDSTADDQNGTALSPLTADLTYEIDPDETPSEAVVLAVASLTNTPILDLEPLYDVIDPVHLDGLLEGDECGRDDRRRSIAFEFGGCHVAVTPGVVHVRDADRDTD